MLRCARLDAVVCDEDADDDDVTFFGTLDHCDSDDNNRDGDHLLSPRPSSRVAFAIALLVL